MLKLYLDIDGVLLTARNPRPADYAKEFIEFVTANFDCYWLTTHCQGDAKPASDYLSEYFDETTMELLRTIKPTRWGALKTDAIDFDSEFVWIDDYAMLAEKEVLKGHKALQALMLIDLSGQNNLRNAQECLQRVLK